MAKKNVTTQDELHEDEVKEPRVYELGFHLDPELPQEEVKNTYQTIREHIARVGTIIAEGEPVKIPLAYRISRMDTSGRRDFSSASFCWIAYEADGSGHDQISAMARENTQIIRFLDIRSSADEAKHSADMQELFAEATARDSEEESSELEPESAPVVAPVEEELA